MALDNPSAIVYNLAVKNMRQKQVIFLLMTLVFVVGCSHPQQLPDIDRYNLASPADLKQIVILDEAFRVLETPAYDLTLALFGYKKLLIMFVKIDNKTDENIKPDEYSFALYDGRDYLPIKMITPKDLNDIQAKLANPKGFSLLNPSLSGVMDTVNSLTNFPAQSVLSQELRKAVDQYFSFRPIYSHEVRKGFLAFYHDFKLEYPLTFAFQIKDKELFFTYYPQQVTRSK